MKRGSGLGPESGEEGLGPWGLLQFLLVMLIPRAVEYDAILTSATFQLHGLKHHAE